MSVFLFSAALVNRVLLAKISTRFYTGDLDLSLLGVEVSSRAENCKIFVNEALSNERFKLFCNLKSDAKGLGVKYVWHRGERFMVRARSGDRAHVFEPLSDLRYYLHRIARSCNLSLATLQVLPRRARQAGERTASHIAGKWFFCVGGPMMGCGGEWGCCGWRIFKGRFFKRSTSF